ncbi:MAG: hypothetical protein CMP12_07070 [Zunongwangia sp.]|jgi:glycosyltransferase involved in cell wall biosynthesis|uniref:glycosyltransferase family 2 protein n=1 Tax=Zunongwangia profunda TaxID=398743 RepID=UPI000C8A9CFD|nr:glycosyltransferase family 2 protein [Zunongwangia profunda]MAO35665.1 hypothetical protein [Zunongwangia sp.]MCC4230162.1 glycosyltransferase [Zunongwangia profunda]|tara:strand:+ start:5760 stop:6674 length:915 start_codon:yes stop_codon:yes gene_type:complete
MTQPIISVIIPTYNRYHLIGETLESLIAQSFLPWECIVVDDGSKDYTNELLWFYTQKDSRIKYFQRPENMPKGANSCRNYGLRQSKGKYINWLDSDDLIYSDKLEKQLSNIEEYGAEIAICKYGYLKLNNKIRFIEKKRVYNNFDTGVDLLKTFGKYQEYLPVHTYLIARGVFNSAGIWNEMISINQDGEFLSRILSKCERVIFVDTYVIYRKSQIDNVSLVSDEKKGEGLIQSWKLIEENLRFHTECKEYVLSGKKTVYNRLKNKYDSLILNDLLFFKPTMSKVNYMLLVTKLKYKKFEKYFN